MMVWKQIIYTADKMFVVNGASTTFPLRMNDQDFLCKLIFLFYTTRWYTNVQKLCLPFPFFTGSFFQSAWKTWCNKKRNHQWLCLIFSLLFPFFLSLARFCLFVKFLFLMFDACYVIKLMGDSTNMAWFHGWSIKQFFNCNNAYRTQFNH